MEIDIVRKKELLMEKKLRACRVNIIPRVGHLYLLYNNNNNVTPQSAGYFPPSSPAPSSRPRSPTPPPPTPSPEAVEKATNPIALRYWNQCLDKNSEASRSGPEVMRVLSTAGSGINRNNEVLEARNNINRFITVDKVKKKDVERMSRSQSQSRLEAPPVKPPQYSLVKEEQIKISQSRANFQNKAMNLVAKSPQPFRRGLSETRTVGREERPEVRVNLTPQHERQELINGENLRTLNDNQKAKLIQVRPEIDKKNVNFYIVY